MTMSVRDHNLEIINFKDRLDKMLPNVRAPALVLDSLEQVAAVRQHQQVLNGRLLKFGAVVVQAQPGRPRRTAKPCGGWHSPTKRAAPRRGVFEEWPARGPRRLDTNLNTTRHPQPFHLRSLR